MACARRIWATAQHEANSRSPIDASLSMLWLHHKINYKFPRHCQKTITRDWAMAKTKPNWLDGVTKESLFWHMQPRKQKSFAHALLSKLTASKTHLYTNVSVGRRLVEFHILFQFQCMVCRAYKSPNKTLIDHPQKVTGLQVLWRFLWLPTNLNYKMPLITFTGSMHSQVMFKAPVSSCSNLAPSIWNLCI